MALNLGNAANFATATLSNASSILNALSGLNNEKWNIQEASYGHPPGPQVLFHIFQTAADYNAAVDEVQDTIARRVVPFEFPYIDGQTTDDLGRKGESFEFNVLIFGPNYYAAYKTLINEFQQAAPGTLVHPVRGRMTAKFDSATVTHKSAEKQAVTLRVKFVEHNFNVSFQAAAPTTKSALATAVGFIASITNIVNKVQSNLAVLSSVKALATQIINSYSTNYTATLVGLNTAFNNGSSSDIPSLLTNTPGNVTAFPTAVSPTDPFANLSTEEIQATVAPALAANSATNLVIALRQQALTLIETLEDINGGQGALIFYDDILTIKQSAIAIQNALEIGIQTSNASILNFTVPVIMDIREVCFANGLSPDRSQDILTLNPSLLSANYIPQGTVLLVPSS